MCCLRLPSSVASASSSSRMCASRYLKVELFNNGTLCSRYVHRLVVEAFIGEIPAGLEVNHISGQKVDNSIENLEVVTHAENTKHAWETGLRSRTTFKMAA
jgi:hypothetical protein